ncbi:LysE family translocator [Amycolatopsis sp. NPDC101161]|uniref:LysE family translocator n=1 Tax=Amycolatopsis sp. NPDC101161 TaxID=3363940 RepID=UPI0038157CE3
MAVGAVVAFWGVAILLVLTPGADWAYVIGAGLRSRSVVPAITGLLVGYLVLTAVVAAGVGALVSSSPVVLTVLTTVGGLYLIWLGINALLRPAGVGEADGGAGTWMRQAAIGAGTSGLNPKALLLFLALLPQFTTPSSAWPLAAQIMVLGLVFVTSCAIVYTAVAVGSRLILSARPSWARIVSRCSGAAMLTIGAVLLLHQIAA